MWWDRERPWVVLVPPVMAGLLMLGYFWLFDRWTELENPIASQLAILTAFLGFLAGLAAQRITRWWWVAVPAALTLGMLLWAYFYDPATPDDEDFRQLLWVMTFLLAIGTVIVNLPQILNGRHMPPPEEEKLT